jgi:hypothetical protein
VGLDQPGDAVAGAAGLFGGGGGGGFLVGKWDCTKFGYA